MTMQPDWAALEAEVYQLFSPGAPIRVESELAGRSEQASKLRNIAISIGEHALIYGERGVGKTSVSNAFYGSLNRPTRPVVSISVNCGGASFTEVWRKVFRRIDTATGPLVTHYPDAITPDDVEIELGNFGVNVNLIVILDEFDQIKDDIERAKFTETIKSLSDHSVGATIILVGIADNAAQLIQDHRSISRALKQVEMPRLSLSELEAIVSSRYKQAALKWEDEAIFLIAFLARGLPYYAHLCGRYAALSAIREKRTRVLVTDVMGGFSAALEEVDQSITESYLTATVSQRGEATLYEPVLLACALADSDQLGQFQQAAVARPLSHLVNRQPPYTPTTFAFHMNEFCEEKRGSVLLRSGPTRNFRYRFADALMQPYVILAALRDSRVTLNTILSFLPKRQIDMNL